LSRRKGVPDSPFFDGESRETVYVKIDSGQKNDGVFACQAKFFLIKSFWKSGNLFSKRFLAAGGTD